jgi:hypothetical protein
MRERFHLLLPGRRALATIAVLVTAAFALLSGGADHSASALDNSVIVYKDPAGANVFLGAPPLSIAERVTNVPAGLGLGAFQIKVTFDPAAVALEVSEGPFLASTGRATGCFQYPGAGEVTFDCYSTGSAPGPTGSGVLAYIAVRPATGLVLRAVPNNYRDVFLNDVASSTSLANTLGQSISIYQVSDSRVFVRPLESDVNVDCAVDSTDVDIVGSRLGATAGSPEYDPLYDLDPAATPDGDIDIFDVVAVSSREGSTCGSPVPPQPPPPPQCIDQDGDAVCDKIDPDDDNDGMPDKVEASYGTDPLDADSDDDGLSDGAEVNTHGTDPLDPDSDDDGLSDGEEVGTYGTSPLLPDTEADGMPDPFEVARLSCGLDPLADDGSGDADADAFSNLGEYGYGTEPCLADSDQDGCLDGAEMQTSAGSETEGGLRDPLNPWDYFNPTQDGQNRADDMLVVVQHYGADAGVGDPRYSTEYDRTYLGPNVWNLGPPNGHVRVDDILAQTRQYYHDCA